MNVNPFRVGWSIIVSATRSTPGSGSVGSAASFGGVVGSAGRSQKSTEEPGKWLLSAGQRGEGWSHVPLARGTCAAAYRVSGSGAEARTWTWTPNFLVFCQRFGGDATSSHPRSNARGMNSVHEACKHSRHGRNPRANPCKATSNSPTALDDRHVRAELNFFTPEHDAVIVLEAPFALVPFLVERVEVQRDVERAGPREGRRVELRVSVSFVLAGVNVVFVCGIRSQISVSITIRSSRNPRRFMLAEVTRPMADDVRHAHVLPHVQLCVIGHTHNICPIRDTRRQRLRLLTCGCEIAIALSGLGRLRRYAMSGGEMSAQQSQM